MGTKIKAKITLTLKVEATYDAADYIDDLDFQECFNEEGEVDEEKFLEAVQGQIENQNDGFLFEELNDLRGSDLVVEVS